MRRRTRLKVIYIRNVRITIVSYNFVTRQTHVFNCIFILFLKLEIVIEYYKINLYLNRLYTPSSKMTVLSPVIENDEMRKITSEFIRLGGESIFYYVIMAFTYLKNFIYIVLPFFINIKPVNININFTYQGHKIGG